MAFVVGFTSWEHKRTCLQNYAENHISNTEHLSHTSCIDKEHPKESLGRHWKQAKIMQASKAGKNFRRKLKKNRRFKMQHQSRHQPDSHDLHEKTCCSHQFSSRPLNMNVDLFTSQGAVSELWNREAEYSCKIKDFYENQQIGPHLQRFQDGQKFIASFKARNEKCFGNKKINPQNISRDVRIPSFRARENDCVQSLNINSIDLSPVDSRWISSKHRGRERPHKINRYPPSLLHTTRFIHNDWRQRKESGNGEKYPFNKRCKWTSRSYRNCSSEQPAVVSSEKVRVLEGRFKKALGIPQPKRKSGNCRVYGLDSRRHIRFSSERQFDVESQETPKCVVNGDFSDALESCPTRERIAVVKSLRHKREVNATHRNGCARNKKVPMMTPTKSFLPVLSSPNSSGSNIAVVSRVRPGAVEGRSQRSFGLYPHDLEPENTGVYSPDSRKHVRFKERGCDVKPWETTECFAIEDGSDGLDGGPAREGLTAMRSFQNESVVSAVANSDRPSRRTSTSLCKSLCEVKPDCMESKLPKATQEKSFPPLGSSSVNDSNAISKFAGTNSGSEQLKKPPVCVVIDDTSDDSDGEEIGSKAMTKELGKKLHSLSEGTVAEESRGSGYPVSRARPIKSKVSKSVAGGRLKCKPRIAVRGSASEVSLEKGKHSGRNSDHVSCETDLLKKEVHASKKKRLGNRKVFPANANREDSSDSFKEASAVGLNVRRKDVPSRPVEPEDCIFLTDSSDSLDSSPMKALSINRPAKVTDQASNQRREKSDELVQLKYTASRIFPDERKWNSRKHLLTKKYEPVNLSSYLYGRPDDGRDELFFTAQSVRQITNAGIECMTGRWREREVRQLHENVVWYCNFFGVSVDQMLDPGLQPKGRNVSVPLSYKIHRSHFHVGVKFESLYAPKPDLFGEAFTREEEKALLELYRKYGRRWKIIGSKMGRRAEAVHQKFTRLEDCGFEESDEKLQFTSKEDEALAKAVKSMAMDQFGNIDVGRVKWRRVASLVGTRNARSCHRRWFTAISGPGSIHNDVPRDETDSTIQKVRSFIITEGIEDLADIDWKHLATILDIPMSWRILRRKFYDFLYRRLDDFKSKSSSEVLQFIRESCKSSFGYVK